MSKSVFIQELVREDDGRWRMAIGEVGSAEILSNEMFPLGTQAPYGFTIEEEMIQHDPEIGHFYLAGVTEETVQAMEQGFADAFRSANFPWGRAQEEGMVRTWFKETGEFLDISQEQFAESFCDEFVSVHYPNLREMTIWDLLETWPVEFSYANGMKFVTYFGDIDLVGRDYYDFYWNDSGLIFPVNSNWETLLNVTNTPRLWNYCAKVAAIDAEIRAQALEIGEAIAIFADAVARLAKDSQPDIPDVP